MATRFDPSEKAPAKEATQGRATGTRDKGYTR
jgi:hypothetical protein